MTNWTVTSVTTERVTSIPAPVRTRTRITSRGKVAVAVLYTALALAVAPYVVGAIVDASNYEVDKAAHIGATHTQMISDKKAGLTR